MGRMLQVFVMLEVIPANSKVLRDFPTTALSPIPNDYSQDKLPIIPAGSELVLDFGGDFGVYAMAEVQGVIHRVKIEVYHLHLIDWTPFEHLIQGVADGSITKYTYRHSGDALGDEF
jgi:hypothetical protein